MAAATATAISAINATPPDAKAAMIMALTTAAVLIHLHIAMSLHKDLMIIHRNPASWVTRRRSKIASAFSMLESSASLQLSKNTCTPFSNFEDPLIASSVCLSCLPCWRCQVKFHKLSGQVPRLERQSLRTEDTTWSNWYRCPAFLKKDHNISWGRPEWSLKWTVHMVFEILV